MPPASANRVHVRLYAIVIVETQLLKAGLPCGFTTYACAHGLACVSRLVEAAVESRTTAALRRQQCGAVRAVYNRTQWESPRLRAVQYSSGRCAVDCDSAAVLSAFRGPLHFTSLRVHTGSHEIDCVCWRPTGDLMENIYSFFLGGE